MRAIGTSVDPNALGGLMVFLTIISVAHFFAGKAILPRRYLLIISTLMLVALYLTFSRGSLLGVVAGLGIIGLLRYRKMVWAMVGVAALG